VSEKVKTAIRKAAGAAGAGLEAASRNVWGMGVADGLEIAGIALFVLGLWYSHKFRNEERCESQR
jgi:Na+/H+-translocating membrane pyrophosphatase